MASIAIIGSGISGMGAAHLLHPHHAITVYEKAPRVGGHSRTVTVDAGGKSIAVDTGFIVYNEPNYPNLVGLFKQLGVPTHESNMSFAASINRGAFEWCARDVNGIFGQRRNIFSPKFYGMVRDVMRFNREAMAVAEAQPELTIGGLLDALKLGAGFRRYYLLPMAGAIWSCPPAQMLEFPAATLTRFFKNHGLLTLSDQPQWYTVTGGAQEYVKRITAAYADRIRVNCGAVSIRRVGERVEVTDTTGACETYDRVVLACHGDQALALLTDASDDERRILGHFKTQNNMAYLHGDVTQMPVRRRCWASWVYQAKGAVGQEANLGVTYWMNNLQGLDAAVPLFVTLNPTHPIAQDKIYDQHAFAHPIFTREAIAAQGEIERLQGQRNTWFCGAWQRYGFHEDGLGSAVKVAQQMGAPIPWH
ncbi:MAG: NAD(P)/FAD-dependent oxidoreductase [Rickettsiales bacterium]